MNVSVSVDVPADVCVYMENPLQFERFIIVSIIGTSVAVISVIENLFLSIMFFTRKSYRSSHYLYLALLAFFDVLIGGSYIPLMSLSNMVDYFQSVVLLRAWFSYMVPMITISHIAMTASSFLMVAATYERYCITVLPKYTKFLNVHRLKIATASVLLGILTKVTHAFEFTIETVAECVGTMNEFSLSISEFAKNPTYAAFFKIWIRSVFTILLPFALLAYMNIHIVIAIQQTEFHFLSSQKLTDAKRKSRVRAATRTLALVVFTYLLSNVLNVVITIWEYFDIDTLQVDFVGFYMISVDLVSLLTIVAGALRLPIYMTCQPELRKEFVEKLRSLCYVSPYKGYSQTCLASGGGAGLADDLPEDPEEARYPAMFLHLGTALIKKESKVMMKTEIQVD